MNWERRHQRQEELRRLRKQAKRIPPPGKPGGPCKQQCGHFRCHRNTALASSNCILCGKRIGFGRLFVMRDSWTCSHYSCVLTPRSYAKRLNEPTRDRRVKDG